MPLTLEVVGAKAARMGGAARKTFSGGGTIGRLADNDWVFPDEYISGHHAKISLANGTFLIEDTSTNGVFINSQQNRLTRHKPHPLRSGDTLFIDDYEVRVTLAAEPVMEGYAPARGRGAGGSLLPDDPFFDIGPGAGAPNSTDPLALLGLQNPPPLAPGPSVASLQSNSPLSQHYRPPTPAPPHLSASMPVASPSRDILPRATPVPPSIPDDYDPMGAEDDPFADPALASTPRPGPAAPPVIPRAAAQSARGSASAAHQRAGAPPERPAAAQPSTAPTIVTGAPRFPEPGLKTATAESAGPLRPDAGRALGDGMVAAPDPLPPPRPKIPARPDASAAGASKRSASATPPPSPRSTAAPGARDAAAGAVDLDFATMLEAAGIDAARVTPEFSQQFGMILRVVVAGLMDVLRARDHIKDEFRMRMTTFKQADNNPLKFSANVEDALHNLLVKRNAAYLGPVEAFKDAFLDVRNHQMAMLAGVRVAYEAMLREFDPEALQREFDPHAKGANFLSGGPKARYWELYRNKFHAMVKDADSSFRQLFGDDFAKAYEEQLSRLRAADRAERK